MKDFELIKIDNIEENPLLQNMMDHDLVRDNNGHANHVLYWNLHSPVWKECENEVMIMERGNSITSYLQNVNSKEN